jgi:hypothetical protein
MGEQIQSPGSHNIRPQGPFHQTIAYHPQSNGMVEHFHRGLKDALRAR